MNCKNCNTPIEQDEDGDWWHSEECPEGTPCYEGMRGAEPTPSTGNRPAVQIGLDTRALEDIAEMLRDPDWGVGMLEDIADIVRKTGRDVSDYPDGRDTWMRH